MKKFFEICETILKDDNIHSSILKTNIFNTNVISEDVYLNDIFNELITYFVEQFQNIPTIEKFFKLSTDDFKQFVPCSFSGKVYLKQQKTFFVVICNFHQYSFRHFKFNSNDKLLIQKNLSMSNGFILSNLSCLQSNEYILFLNRKIFISPVEEFRNTLIHEFIHIFQIISGRSIYDVLTTKTLEISNEEEGEINKCFQTSKNFDIESIIGNLLNQYELLNYCQQIAYVLKQYLNRDELKEFFYILTQPILTFTQRFHHINTYPWFSQLKINYQLFLLLSAHFKLGINSVKNHIFSYFDKIDENI